VEWMPDRLWRDPEMYGEVPGKTWWLLRKVLVGMARRTNGMKTASRGDYGNIAMGSDV
jgi:hypothetical protein